LQKRVLYSKLQTQYDHQYPEQQQQQQQQWQQHKKQQLNTSVKNLTLFLQP
jgi:hypothetical protein